ncbi:MAG: hypothetical protein QOJ50_2654 [Cryptosporangiaceae bacterium]|nr:hypothetical protein [Cryptosporangiaceae bacterium]
MTRLPAILAVLARAACGPAAKHEPAAVSFHGNGVTVTVTRRSASELAVVFAPDRSGFHLYSADLPRGGVDGIGVPTSVALEGGLRAAGPAVPSRSAVPITVEGLAKPVPVYPDGPVTFAVPVDPAGRGAESVVVSYAACSEAECLPPVIAQRIGLRAG